MVKATKSCMKDEIIPFWFFKKVHIKEFYQMKHCLSSSLQVP